MKGSVASLRRSVDEISFRSLAAPILIWGLLVISFSILSVATCIYAGQPGKIAEFFFSFINLHYVNISWESRIILAAFNWVTAVCTILLFLNSAISRVRQLGHAFSGLK